MTDAVIEINAGREPICGILMLINRANSDAAFGVLRWRSQECNEKLRKLAEQLLADIEGLEYDDHVLRREVSTA